MFVCTHPPAQVYNHVGHPFRFNYLHVYTHMSMYVLVCVFVCVSVCMFGGQGSRALPRRDRSDRYWSSLFQSSKDPLKPVCFWESPVCIPGEREGERDNHNQCLILHSEQRSHSAFTSFFVPDWQQQNKICQYTNGQITKVSKCQYACFVLMSSVKKIQKR